MSLVCPSLEYGSACWDPCREGQTNALDPVQKRGAWFADYTRDSERETLAQHRMTACLCALFKAYSGTGLESYMRQVAKTLLFEWGHHVRKIRNRKQRTDIGKYSFVNRTIKNWNQLPAETLGTFPCKPKIFRNRVRKAIINGVNWKE